MELTLNEIGVPLEEISRISNKESQADDHYSACQAGIFVFIEGL